MGLRKMTERREDRRREAASNALIREAGKLLEGIGEKVEAMGCGLAFTILAVDGDKVYTNGARYGIKRVDAHIIAMVDMLSAASTDAGEDLFTKFVVAYKNAQAGNGVKKSG